MHAPPASLEAVRCASCTCTTDAWRVIDAVRWLSPDTDASECERLMLPSTLKVSVGDGSGACPAPPEGTLAVTSTCLYSIHVFVGEGGDVCVCVRGREGGRQTDRERERARKCVCVKERKRLSLAVRVTPPPDTARSATPRRSDSLWAVCDSFSYILYFRCSLDKI